MKKNEKVWLSISECKPYGWKESELRRIAHSDYADRYCRRTSPRGKFMFDIEQLNKDAYQLAFIGEE